ncbi:glycosyltransferase [Rhodococcus ruber]|nr:glycosyltransferase [Rhodococcus ruber]
MPLVWSRGFRVDPEWALISSHLFAHQVKFEGTADTEYYVYVHTPARYIWSPELDQRGSSLAVRAVSPIFKHVDRRRARPRSNYVGNSNFVVQRIRRAWDVDAKCIYPPVDVCHIQSVNEWADELDGEERKRLDSLPTEFILAASRLVPYKRIDAAIRAGEQAGLPVVIAGTGPDDIRLRSIAEEAKVPVEFLGAVSSPMLYALYGQCTVYVFAGIEDFGIMPVEAMATGAPVVGNICGGVAETVIDGVTGALCDPDDPRSLDDAIHRAAACSRANSRERARKFSVERFASEISQWVSGSPTAAISQAYRTMK